jgi:hypothetical protein
MALQGLPPKESRRSLGDDCGLGEGCAGDDSSGDDSGSGPVSVLLTVEVLAVGCDSALPASADGCGLAPSGCCAPPDKSLPPCDSSGC